MTMQLAASSMLAQGSTPMEQLAFLRHCGFAGMELRLTQSDADLPAYLASLHEALERTAMRICSVITPDPTFSRAFDGRDSMEAKLASIARNLRIAGPLGAVSLFCPEYRAQQPLPLWTPPPPMTDWERELLVELLCRAAKVAEQVGGVVVIEPLNRYETHLVHRLDAAVELCQAVDSPRVGILADFYHMNLEEAHIDRSIAAAGQWIRHIQLADSNRYLPGQGHMDYRPGLRALLESGYTGFLALECRAQGSLDEALSRCVQFLHNEWAACR